MGWGCYGASGDLRRCNPRAGSSLVKVLLPTFGGCVRAKSLLESKGGLYC